MTNVAQKLAAKQFADFWKGKGYEKGQSQSFWLSLLGNVYGIEHPEQFITFEDKVHLDHTSFIDAYISATHVMIEQKSIDKALDKKIKQADNSFLTPFDQAKRYASELPYSQRPRWIVTCNFKEFRVYDMENPSADPEIILLKNLDKEYYRLEFLVNEIDHNAKKEEKVSEEAGELVAKLYDALLMQYIHPDSADSLKSLNMLCVRLVFCLYAEDAGIFGKRNMFYDYLKSFQATNMRLGLINLFKVLDQEQKDRDPYMEKGLAAFPHVNGGLFAEENIEIPQFNEEIRTMLLENASAGFDWSGISPTIFGSVFESTLNPETRRSRGMHYTSIENIHKVIDPLFLDDLKEELAKIKKVQIIKTKKQQLEAFTTRLSKLNFLDPACGSGNFLTETYISLRRLENEAIKEYLGVEIILGGIHNPIKVSIGQFYGIEINDFAATVAKTALWIAESQMFEETQSIVSFDEDFLPLKRYANIVDGNALMINWEDVVSKDKLNYIIGNPPFIGARLMSEVQKQDVINVFGDEWKNVGNLDYVSCWYKKATDIMIGTNIRSALVSTNSICQGEAVANLWEPLFRIGVHIDFAYRSFLWNNGAKSQAHVHCIIIGFSTAKYYKDKIIFTSNQPIIAKNINAYLTDDENFFVGSRSEPICNSPKIGIGNKPIDGGYYLFSKDEMENFIKVEPASKIWFKPWYGSDEFINNRPRYCLWLGNCPPSELRKMPECLKRVQAVKAYRKTSKSPGTRNLGDNPTHFHVENMPSTKYIVIPEVSTAKRRYVPMGYLTPDILCSNLVKIIPDATLYHFGVLTSNVHMAWMRAVCGRLANGYRYSKDVVYNNFPWPAPTEVQKAKIEKTAQLILDVRALYPDTSLADLYDELTMPTKLRRAHQVNDRAVMEAYGFWGKINSESECVAELMKMYKELTKNNS